MPQTYDYGELEVKPKAKVKSYDYGALETAPSVAPVAPQQPRDMESYLNPNDPHYQLQSTVLEAAKGADQVLRGGVNLIRHPLDNAVIPAAEAAGSIGKDLATGSFIKAGGTAMDVLRGMLHPVTTSVQGAGALVAPKTIPAPSPQDFAQAQQEAGANAAGLAVGAGATKLLGKVAGKISVPPGDPNEVYRTALRKGVPYGSEIDANRALAKTGIDYGIPVSEEGLQKIGKLIKGLDDAVKTDVQKGAARGVTVNKYAVASRLSDQAAGAAKQVNPTADLGQITKAGNEFLATQPGEIPADQALEIKKGTYRAMGEKAYGEEKAATLEAQKTLARGIREELANLFPDSAEILKEEGRLIPLQDAIEKVVNKTLNGQTTSGPGLKTAAAALTAKALTGSGLAGAGIGMLKAVVDDPAVRSQMAIAMSKPGTGAATSLLKIMRVSGMLSAAQRKATPTTDH